MSEDNAQQEPTMEEILASIRRIISEDSEGGQAEPTLQSRNLDDRPDVLELTDTLEEPVLVINQPEPVEVDEDDWDKDEPEAEAPSLEEAVFDEFDDFEEEEIVVAMPDPVPTPAFAAIEDDFDEPEFDPDPEFAPEPEPAPQPEPEPMFEVEEDLLSASAAGAASASFDSLSRALPIAEDDGRTLEGIVSDMLRPILKDWLDQNLPAIVEDLVQKEIERVSGRGD